MKLADIHVTPALQPRAKCNSEVAEEYAERMRAGDKFPPLVAFQVTDKTYPAPALVAGFTRRMAYCRAGIDEFEVEIRTGTFAEAWLFGYLSNDNHGLRYTNADKRNAVEVACLLFPTDSAGVIANRLKVSDEFVRRIRKELVAAGKLEAPNQVTGADGVSQSAHKKRSNTDKNPVPTVGTGDTPTPRLATAPAEYEPVNEPEATEAESEAEPFTGTSTDGAGRAPDFAAGGLLMEVKTDAKDRVAEARAKFDAAIRALREADEAIRAARASMGGPLLDRVTRNGNPLLIQRTVRERKGTGTVQRSVLSFGVAPAVAARILKDLRPKAVCAGCRGAGCVACRMLGFVPDEQWWIQDNQQLAFAFDGPEWEGGAA